MYSNSLSLLAGFCRRRPAIAVMSATLLILIVPAALTPFNTKGEPREAIVALSMLLSGDWILPVSFGTDIPYKPPFLAWIIALLSLPAGYVSEFTARAPSIIACMCLAGTVASFVRRDMGWSGGRAFAAALLAVTTVEVWRSAGACRVDMVLTAAITGACVVLYRMAQHWSIGRFCGAVALMTVAVLTKGPVGVVLPCLIIAVWAFWMRPGWHKLSRLALVVLLAALLSLLLPAWWYWEAYIRGGERFLALALEENFGRMTGTMSYASHLNPWWYNLQTLAAGLLPYTLISFLALFGIRRKSLTAPRQPLGSAAKLAVAVCVVTLIFYTIPASKRSVYLLPMYPFLAIGLLKLWEWLEQRARKAAKIFRGLILGVGILFTVVLLIAPFLSGFEVMNKWMCLSGALIVIFVITFSRRMASIPASLALIAATYTIVGIAVLPGVMEQKTDRDLAEVVAAVAAEKEPVWEIISEDSLLRYYTAGFYLGDRIRLMPTDGSVVEGWLLASPDDASKFAADNPSVALTLTWQKTRSCDTRRPVGLYRIVKE